MSETNEIKDKIIVAEDSPPNRKILSHVLSKLGYEVMDFENGADAWQSLEANSKGVVAVISDIMMPTMDGIQLLQKIRETSHLKDLPVLLITAVSDRDYIAQAKNLNVNGYILKPVTFQRVMQKLKSLFPNKVFPKLAA